MPTRAALNTACGGAEDKVSTRTHRKAPSMHPHRALLRRLAVLGAVSVASTALLLPSLAQPAAATTAVNGVRLNAYEARLVADINAARAQQHLRALVVTPGTTDVARSWSWHLAGAGALSHNPRLVTDIARAGSPGWTNLAENVGYSSASTPDTLFSAYMHSPEHRANILDPTVRYLGVGVVERALDGTMFAWNTLDFVDQYSAAYGPTRQPADGMHLDTRVVTRTIDIANFETGVDQRVRTAGAGTVRASLPRFDRPSRGDDAVRYTLALAGRPVGYGDLVLRDALDLRHVRAVQLRVRVADRAWRAVPLTVLAQAPWEAGGSVTLGTVTVRPAVGWVTVPVPPAARRFRNALVLRVPAGALTRTGGPVVVAVADIRLTV